MDVESYAMQQAFELISPSLPASGRDQNIALVDIGAHVTHFYVLRNNQFLFSRDQAFGGNQLTHDIQRRSTYPRRSRVAKKKPGPAGELRRRSCCSRSWKRWRSRSPARCSSSSRRPRTTRSTRVVLAGGCALLPGLDELSPSVPASDRRRQPFANMATSDRIRPRQLARTRRCC
jgi:type IV pilus assembly protein PilM